MNRDRMLIALAGAGLVIAIALVIAIVVAAHGSDRQPQASGPPPGPYRGSEPPGQNELVPFALAGYRGGRVSSAQLRGKVVALTFLESKCKEACPIIAVQVARGVDLLIGTERELRPVWRRYHILSALDSGDADTHSASLHIYDRNGVWVSSLHPGIDLTPENFVHDVRRALQSS